MADIRLAHMLIIGQFIDLFILMKLYTYFKYLYPYDEMAFNRF